MAFDRVKLSIIVGLAFAVTIGIINTGNFERFVNTIWNLEKLRDIKNN